VLDIFSIQDKRVPIAVGVIIGVGVGIGIGIEGKKIDPDPDSDPDTDGNREQTDRQQLAAGVGGTGNALPVLRSNKRLPSYSKRPKDVRAVPTPGVWTYFQYRTNASRSR
jgi:hypothetical protein